MVHWHEIWPQKIFLTFKHKDFNDQRSTPKPFPLKKLPKLTKCVLITQLTDQGAEKATAATHMLQMEFEVEVKVTLESSDLRLYLHKSLHCMKIWSQAIFKTD